MKNINSLKLNLNYQISLPREICQQHGLIPGNELLLYIQGDLLILQPKPQNLVNHLAGLHRDVWQNINPNAYLNEERNQWGDSNH